MTEDKNEVGHTEADQVVESRPVKNWRKGEIVNRPHDSGAHEKRHHGEQESPYRGSRHNECRRGGYE